MKQDHDHDPLAQVARRLLQDSEQFIDAMSAARLSAARRCAVAQLTPVESRWYVFRRRWPALAGATAATVLIALLLPRVDRPALDADALDYATRHLRRPGVLPVGRRTGPRWLAALAVMTLPTQAVEPPPDAELLEFLGQWGDAAAVLDEPEDDPAPDDTRPAPHDTEGNDDAR